MNGAELLVKCLAANGVDTVFGMPGGQSAPVYGALYGCSAVRHVLVRNEHAGAFMADGYARATGRPGVCLVTAGPGLTNCLTGMGTAYSDSIPMLVISGQIPRDAIGADRGYYHEMDALGVTSPLTKWNACAASADEIPELVGRAFLEMKGGRPRPVHLDFPVDVLKEETDAVPLQAGSPAGTEIDSRSIEEAAALLNGAQRPLIIAGGGVVSAGAMDELRELAELLHAPVHTTPMGMGAIPDDHPLSHGTVLQRTTSDLSNMREHLSPLPALADKVLAVGCRFSQLATGNWALELPGELIQLDIDEAEFGRNYPTKAAILADAKGGLSRLTEELRKRGAETRQRAWGAILDSLPVPDRWHIEGFDIAPIIRRAIERDAIIACDITRLYYMMITNFPVYEPRTFLHSSCFISMGYGFPAAIGAKVAFPERQVIAVAGDGGFMMTAQELACAVQERINVVVVLINDNCLSAIKGIQNRSYGGRHIAVDLINPDFVRFTESFGALGLRVTRVEEFEPALRQALEAGKPAVIEVQAPQTAV